MTKNLVFTFLLLLPLLSSRAQWSPQSQKHFREAAGRLKGLDHAGYATFWGGFQRSLHLTFNDGRSEDWPTPLFRSGKLGVYLSQKAGPAPLIVYLPGMFGSLEEGLTPMMIDLFERQGAHVLVVPNLLSVPYAKAHPIYEGGAVKHEVDTMAWAYAEALKRLGNKVSKVHVVAESLGSIVGAAWVTQHVEEGKSFDSLTILFPPQDLARALDNFDQTIKELAPARGDCSRLTLMWELATKIVLRNEPGEVSLRHQRCFAATVVVEAFLRSAYKTQRAAWPEMKLPDSEMMESLGHFFQSYRPELWALIEKRDAGLKLAPWIGRIHQKSAMPIRILTARDDFLNRGLSWAQFLDETKLSSDHVLILDWGGHSGSLGLKELPELLGEALGLSAAR